MSPASNTRKWLVLSGLLAALPLLSLAQGNLVPQGGETPVSGGLNGDQTHPVAAFNASGGWVVWQDNGIDGHGLGVAARQLDASLNPSGAPLRVNRFVNGDQERPNVSLLNNGGAAVVWQGGRLGLQQIYARFLKADGTFATEDVLVNEPPFDFSTRLTTNWWVFRSNRARYRTQRIKVNVRSDHERTSAATSASLNDGTVVVAYASGRRFTTNVQSLIHRYRWNGRRFVTNSVLGSVPVVSDLMQDVYFQRFTADGTKVGGEVRANQFSAYNQRNPSLAALNDGTFVLSWLTEMQRGETNIDVMARLFDRNGAALGDEFLVNTASRPCGAPSVAASAVGGFSVVWAQKESVRGNSLDIYARAFSASATPVTTGFIVNTHMSGDQYAPRIAAMPAGQLVVWTSLAQDGSREGVYGRQINDGTLAGSEFRVNTTTLLRQMHPAVSADAGNRALVLWSSYQGTAGFDLFGQRYTVPAP